MYYEIEFTFDQQKLKWTVWAANENEALIKARKELNEVIENTKIVSVKKSDDQE